MPLGQPIDCLWVIEKTKFALPLYDQMYLKVHEFSIGTAGKHRFVGFLRALGSGQCVGIGLRETFGHFLGAVGSGQFKYVLLWETFGYFLEAVE